MTLSNCSLFTARAMRAELRRIVGRGGAPVSLMMGVLFGWAAGIGMAFLGSDVKIQASMGIRPSDVVMAGGMSAMLILSVATANYACRDMSSGFLQESRQLLPSPMALIVGRLLAWMIAALAVGVAATSVPLLVGIAMLGCKGLVLMDLIAEFFVFLGGWVVVQLVIYCVGLYVRKAAYVVAAVLFVLLVLPLMLTAVGLLVPPLRSAVTTLSGWMLGTLLVKASIIPRAGESAGQLVQGWVGLSLWLIVALALGWRAMNSQHNEA